MAIQKGSALLLKIKKEQNQPYTTVAGLRTKEISFNAKPIDITNADSTGQWQQLLTTNGVRNLHIEGNGIFTDSTSDAQFRQLFFENKHPNCQIILPHFGTITGNFAITELQYVGEYDGEMNWKIKLQSAGEMNFANA